MISLANDDIRLTRAEVEKACLILGIGGQTITINALIRRLGLDAAHVPAISEVVEQVAREGLIERDADEVSVTPEGNRWVATLFRFTKGE